MTEDSFSQSVDDRRPKHSLLDYVLLIGSVLISTCGLYYVLNYFDRPGSPKFKGNKTAVTQNAANENVTNNPQIDSNFCGNNSTYFELVDPEILSEEPAKISEENIEDVSAEDSQLENMPTVASTQVSTSFTDSGLILSDNDTADDFTLVESELDESSLDPVNNTNDLDHSYANIDSNIIMRTGSEPDTMDVFTDNMS